MNKLIQPEQVAFEALQSERDQLRERVAELVEALNVIAGEPRQDDTYVAMGSKEIARAVLAKGRS